MFNHYPDGVKMDVVVKASARSSKCNPSITILFYRHAHNQPCMEKATGKKMHTPKFLLAVLEDAAVGAALRLAPPVLRVKRVRRLCGPSNKRKCSIVLPSGNFPQTASEQASVCAHINEMSFCLGILDRKM